MNTCLLVIDAQESFRHRPFWSEADLPAYLSAQKTSYQEAGSQEAETTGRVDFCQVLFCLNEFVYVQ